MFSIPMSRENNVLYKIVFGSNKIVGEGFPAPQNDYISALLFTGLLVLSLFLNLFAIFFIMLANILLPLIAFLDDGSIAKGLFPRDMEVKKISPWPILFGRRLSPFIVAIMCAVIFVLYTNGITEAIEYSAIFLLIILAFMSISSKDKSPTQEMAEHYGPKMEEAIRLRYYKKPRFLPCIHFV